MESNADLKIFISHSSEDAGAASIVSELLKASLNLTSKCIRCSSLDGHRFGGGLQIDESIRNDVQNADVLIGLVSSSSAKSAYVLFELGVRWGTDKPLIPVLLPDANVNNLLGPLSGIHALRGDSPGQIHQLVKEVAQYLSVSSEHADNYQKHLDDLCAYSTTIPISDSAFTFSDGGHVLAIGAHWDDFLLGCLGTLIKLRKKFFFDVDILVLSNIYPYGYFGISQPIKEKSDEIFEIICREEGFIDLSSKLSKWIESYQLMDRNFRNNQTVLMSALQNIKAKAERPYNLILSPPMGDRNPDHSMTAEAAFSVFRSSENLVLEYDIKRYTENPFVTNLCVGLDDEYQKDGGKVITIADRKVKLLIDKCGIAKGPECEEDNGKIKNSSHLFSEEALRSRMFVNAQDNGKNKRVKYAEVLHGRIEL